MFVSAQNVQAGRLASCGMWSLQRNSLSPRLADRFRHALRPGWARTIVVRRTASIALVLAAIVVTVVGHRAAQGRSIVVTTHDLPPGRAVTADDLTIRVVPGDLIPFGALRLTADGVGRTPVGSIRAGEILTDARLLSSRLPAQLTGRDDARLVPVHLSDAALPSLLREGDVVDVLTTPDEGAGSATSSVVARNAVVAMTSDAPESGALATSRTAARPLLLAMDESAAHRVAAAGLDAPLAVVLH